MTHRQSKAWSLWLARQWNKPTRSDHYAMQTAAEVRLCRRALTNGDPVSLSDMKIPFVTGSSSPQERVSDTGSKFYPPGWTQEKEEEFQRQQAVMAQASVKAMFGGKIVEKRMTKAEYAEWLETGVYPERLKD